jgi:hypothetical protein
MGHESRPKMAMHVTKRNGQQCPVSFDKVLTRIRKLTDELNVNAHEIAQKVQGVAPPYGAESFVKPTDQYERVGLL